MFCFISYISQEKLEQFIYTFLIAHEPNRANFKIIILKQLG